MTERIIMTECKKLCEKFWDGWHTFSVGPQMKHLRKGQALMSFVSQFDELHGTKLHQAVWPLKEDCGVEFDVWEVTVGPKLDEAFVRLNQAIDELCGH